MIKGLSTNIWFGLGGCFVPWLLFLLILGDCGGCLLPGRKFYAPNMCGQ